MLKQGNRLLRIVQETANRWRVENGNGDVILDGLMLESQYRAEEFIKGYVSSFLCFNYEVVILNKGEDK